MSWFDLSTKDSERQNNFPADWAFRIGKCPRHLPRWVVSFSLGDVIKGHSKPLFYWCVFKLNLSDVWCWFDLAQAKWQRQMSCACFLKQNGTMMRRPEKVFGNNPMWLKESSPAILASNVETMILKSFFLYQKAEKSFFLWFPCDVPDSWPVEQLKFHVPTWISNPPNARVKHSGSSLRLNGSNNVFEGSWVWPGAGVLRLYQWLWVQESSQAEQKAEEALKLLRKTPEAVPGGPSWDTVTHFWCSFQPPFFGVSWTHAILGMSREWGQSSFKMFQGHQAEMFEFLGLGDVASCRFNCSIPGGRDFPLPCEARTDQIDLGWFSGTTNWGL